MDPEKREHSQEELPMIEMPKNFQICYGFDESVARSGLTKAYQEVFAQSPWNEKWSEQEVLEKLKKETDLPGSVTVLMRGEDQSVQGFSWGRIIDAKDVEKEVVSALGVFPNGLDNAIAKKTQGRLFYFHEIAIIPQARFGPDPVRFLVRPALQFSRQEGVTQNIFWSTPESNIVSIASPFNYEKVFECVDAHGHKVVFLLNVEHSNFLEALEHVNGRGLAVLAARAMRK